MMSFTSLIEYLKSPELVVEFQEFFGIDYRKRREKNCGGDDITSPTRPNGNLLNRKEESHKSSSSSSSVSSSSSGEESELTKEKPKLYEVRNKFWYWLFVIGTELGDEIFYATFIPFWFWNIDGAVGRRVIFLWSIVMYIGQSMKDIIRWPRPGPPVIKLQTKWGMEYGMPSTHAMVAISIPFSVLIFTHERYQFPFYVGLIISILWCSVVCLSRLYLGMHSVLDVIVGIILTVGLMFILIPMVDYLDLPIVTSIYSPIFVFGVSILLIYFYPKSDKWTPTRGDTVMTASVCVGLQIGAWINYQMGYLIPPTITPPYVIIWPNYRMFGLLLLRTVFGMCCIVATRAFSKSISYAFVCAILGRDKTEVKNSESTLDNKHKIIVDLCYKYFTYGMIGFNTQFLLPNVFKLLGIGRPDFYTEM